MVREIVPFSFQRNAEATPFVKDDRNSGPKATGAIEPPAEAAPQAEAKSPTPRTPSFEDVMKAEGTGSSSVSPAQSLTNAGPTESTTESSTESGEERTSTTERLDSQEGPTPPEIFMPAESLDGPSSSSDSKVSPPWEMETPTIPKKK